MKGLGGFEALSLKVRCSCLMLESDPQWDEWWVYSMCM